ncbi:alpha/beta fold hydrolase [Carboxydochorda subterranea]|uniref:Alpha/beta fold hydrolase n=1 Tax=Carboxydichorda subterranea TaxID=3109565 RepID=A0ABZ1BTG4_9FIRM|nr:alpha/beta fold hydrolase [Limnochorda sp. L945t]WRP16069.1 alpha/beta fold hydrolase [Limnochorda sp. L945t]
MLRLGKVVLGVGLASVFFAVGAEVFMISRPFEKAPGVSPGDVGLAYEDVVIDGAGGVELRGWLLPARGARRSVILAPAGGENRAEIGGDTSLPLIRKLVEHGFTVLALDMRGYGLSGGRPTWGFLESNDLESAVRFMNARGYPNEAVAVVGFSIGGVAALRLAGRLPELGAVVADGALPSVRWTVRAVLPCCDAAISPLVRLWARVLLGVDVDEIQPVEDLARLDGRRVMLVYGSEDELAKAGAPAVMQAANPQATVVVVPGARHIQAYRINPEAYGERLVRFLDDAMGRPLAPEGAGSSVRPR